MNSTDRIRGVYATMERVMPCGSYGFARAVGGQEDILLHLNQGRRLVHAWFGRFFCLDEPLTNVPGVGDRLLIKTARNTRGLHATWWGYDETPQPWNYGPPLYRRCGSNPGGAKEAFEQFLNLVNDQVDFEDFFVESGVDKAKLAMVAGQYAYERVCSLVMRPHHTADKRPWTATAVLAFVRAVANYYQLDVPLHGMSAMIRSQPMTGAPANTVERIVRELFLYLAAGRPSSAYAGLCAARDEERQRYPEAVVPTAPEESKVDAFLGRALLTPINSAFDEDPALRFLGQTCYRHQRLAQESFAKSLRRSVPHDRASLSYLWNKAHEQDPRLCADKQVGQFLGGRMNAQDIPTLNAMRPLLTDNYPESRKVVDVIPSPEELTLTHIANHVSALLLQGKIEQARSIFNGKGLRQNGGLERFLNGDPERARMKDLLYVEPPPPRVKQVKAAKPPKPSPVIAPTVDEALLLIEEMEQADPAARTTKDWRDKLKRVLMLTQMRVSLKSRAQALFAATPLKQKQAASPRVTA